MYFYSDGFPPGFLYIEASKDQNGQITKFGYIRGFTIETNNIEFIQDNNPRIKAKWESAMQELIDNGLLVKVGYKGEFYGLTQKGFEYADQPTTKTP